MPSTAASHNSIAFADAELSIPLPLSLSLSSSSPAPSRSKADQIEEMSSSGQKQEYLHPYSHPYPYPYPYPSLSKEEDTRDSIQYQSEQLKIPPRQSPYRFTDDREHKLRIVEKLGTVSFALQSEVSYKSRLKVKTDRHHKRSSAAVGYTASSINSGTGTGTGTGTRTGTGMGDEKNKEITTKETKGATSAVQWLNDAQLAELSTSELEAVMDTYLLKVMKQMVQVLSELFLTYKNPKFISLYSILHSALS